MVYEAYLGTRKIRAPAGKLIPVKIIELYDTNEFKDVYNLDNVENNNTFFANKALVHNRAN